VLLGAFQTHPWAAGIATSGVIFAAAYLLWAIQRVLFNREPDAENAKLPDLSRRELVVLAPLVACILWIGLYPQPILHRIEATTSGWVAQMRHGMPDAGLAHGPAGEDAP